MSVCVSAKERERESEAYLHSLRHVVEGGEGSRLRVASNIRLIGGPAAALDMGLVLHPWRGHDIASLLVLWQIVQRCIGRLIRRHISTTLKKHNNHSIRNWTTTHVKARQESKKGINQEKNKTTLYQLQLHQEIQNKHTTPNEKKTPPATSRKCSSQKWKPYQIASGISSHSDSCKEWQKEEPRSHKQTHLWKILGSVKRSAQKHDLALVKCSNKSKEMQEKLRRMQERREGERERRREVMRREGAATHSR